MKEEDKFSIDAKSISDEVGGDQFPMWVTIWIYSTSFLLIYSGVAELIELPFRYLTKSVVHGSIDALNFVLIPVGIGLLRRRSSSHGCVMVLAFVIALVILIGFIYYLKGGGVSIHGIGTPSGSWTAALAPIFLLIWGGVTWWILRKYSEHYNDPELLKVDRRKADVLAWTFVIATVICETSANSHILALDRELDSAYPVEVDIILVDKETGDPVHLHRIGWGHETGYERSRRNDIGQMFNDKEVRGQTVKVASLSGIAFGDIQYELRAKGYESAVVTIGKSTDRNLYVPLVPVKQGQSESSDASTDHSE